MILLYMKNSEILVCKFTYKLFLFGMTRIDRITS